MLQFERPDGGRHSSRLTEVERAGLAMLDVAVAAGTGADPAQDHEGSGAMVPALADVGALGLLADCVEPLVAD